MNFTSPTYSESVTLENPAFYGVVREVGQSGGDRPKLKTNTTFVHDFKIINDRGEHVYLDTKNQNNPYAAVIFDTNQDLGLKPGSGAAQVHGDQFLLIITPTSYSYLDHRTDIYSKDYIRDPNTIYFGYRGYHNDDWRYGILYYD